MIAKIFLICLLVNMTFGQLVYPESDTNANRKPQGHMREPVTSTKCGEGELLYPGDNPADWTCDCKPTYLYYPVTSKCYPAFSKGPCKQNEILVLPKSKSVPTCERNQCQEGKVLYNNLCSKIDSFEGCKQTPKDSRNQRLVVNPTSLQLHCTFSIPPRVGEGEEIYHDDPACFLGGKRSQEGLCTTETT